MLNKKYFIMDTIDKNETEDLLEKGVEFMDTLENPSMDEATQKHKEKVADTIFSIVFFTIVGNVILWYSTLWISILFVIPGISLFLYLFLKLKPIDNEYIKDRSILRNRSFCSLSPSSIRSLPYRKHIQHTRSR
jgi:hypothetical protein